MFRKVLIANRGEIAVRIIRACREMGIRTAAVYSEADRDAMHVRLADEAVCIGPASPKDSYLRMEQIIGTTLALKAEAIHPGFGFLSENAEFARMCGQYGIQFVGPSPELIDKMGNKSEAKRTMKAAGIPVVPGTDFPVYEEEEALAKAKEIGFPIMIKASAGGGGKGMRLAWEEQEFPAKFREAQQEAENAFADHAMYLERYIQFPRHIEVQIMADRQGNVIHLGERDCSIQRRHQKMIEESPCAFITGETRRKLWETALKASHAVGYENAGTLEFLLDQSGEFFFMEMNTRIQVEHPVSELVSGVDLIREQLRVAAGLPLSVKQEDIRFRGHAVECRINAEDPLHNFMPCPGMIKKMHLPGGNGIRMDTAIYPGYQIPPYYDSMIVKVIAYDSDRDGAVRKMISTLGELEIEGVATNRDFLYDVVNHPDFKSGRFHTGFIEENYPM